MATALFDKGREAFLGGEIDWINDDIRFVGVTSAYSVDLAAHDFLDDIPSAARVQASTSLTGKTKTGGVADASDHVLPTVPAGKTISAIVIYVHTGSDATARLIAYIDSGSGLPFVCNGLDITITWSNTSTKIFKL